MSAAVYDTISANIDVNEYNFRASGQSLKFKGFMTLYVETLDNKTDENEESFVPNLKENPRSKKTETRCKAKLYRASTKIHKKPSLVKALEEKGNRQT